MRFTLLATTSWPPAVLILTEAIRGSAVAIEAAIELPLRVQPRNCEERLAGRSLNPRSLP